MDISIVSATGSGGSGVAALRLHDNLRMFGCNSSIFSPMISADPAEQKFRFLPSTKFTDRARRKLRRLSLHFKNRQLDQPTPRIEMFSTARSEFGFEPFSQCPKADIYNMHWVTNFLDLPSWINQLPEASRVVWTLHDMNPFTGGCHYDDGCGRHRDKCGDCPQLATPSASDVSARQFTEKMTALAPLIDSSRLHVVALCSWMANEARESRIFRNVPVHIIPNGIDTEEFAPLKRAACRETLGVPQSSICLLFVCGSLHNYRKGFDLFVESLHQLEQKTPSPLTVLLVGNGFDTGLQLQFPNIQFRAVGPLKDQRLLQAAYSAADIHILPTRADNLPNTIMEAMSCGTPTVAFDVGGIRDMVIPGETGELAEPMNPVALAEAICRLTNQCTTEVGKRCRSFAVQNFDANIQAKKYMKLFEKIHNGE